MLQLVTNVNEIQEQLTNGNLTFRERVRIIFSHLSLDLKFCGQSEVTPLEFKKLYQFLNPTDHKYITETVTRELRYTKARYRNTIEYKINKVIERYETSDCYDTLSYCINDIIPETRNNQQLFDFYYNKVNDFMQVNQLAIVA